MQAAVSIASAPASAAGAWKGIVLRARMDGDGLLMQPMQRSP
jgi:hypothetical protein